MKIIITQNIKLPLYLQYTLIKMAINSKANSTSQFELDAIKKYLKQFKQKIKNKNKN